MCVIKDQEGKIVAGGMRPGVKALEPGSEIQKLAQYEAVQRQSADYWNDYFGGANFIVEHMKKLVAFKFYLSDSRMVVVTAEPSYPVQKAALLLEIVERFKSEV